MRSAFRHYLTKKRIRNVLQVTWRRCYNVSGTAGTLLEEEFSTYQERLVSYLKKMFQRIRNIWQVTWRRCYDLTGTSCNLLDEEFKRIRNILQVTWRRCYNVAGTSCMLLEEDMATYQERLASYFKKMLQRIRNVLQVTWWRCYDVAGTSCLCVHRSMNVITPPHPTPPVTDHDRTVQCLCLQDSKKDDEVAVPVCAQEHERCYPTPSHPIPPHPVPVSAGQQARWWGCCACVCAGTWTLLPHPTPHR